MSAFSAAVTKGLTWKAGDAVSVDNLNAAAAPTVTITAGSPDVLAGVTVTSLAANEALVATSGSAWANKPVAVFSALPTDGQLLQYNTSTGKVTGYTLGSYSDVQNIFNNNHYLPL